MADTSIEWTDKVWNPTTGCDRVSPGCDHCYAMTMAKRLKGMGSAKYQQDGDPRTSGPGFGITEHEDALSVPFGWRSPQKVFVNSMSDLFHDGVSDRFIARVFAVMAASPQHTYQVLTKRHGRMRSLLSPRSAFGDTVLEYLDELPGGRQLMVEQKVPWPLPNVWLGVSVENQQWADIRIPALLDTPAAVRWLSCEPLLGPVDLTRVKTGFGDGHWTVLSDLGVPGTTSIDWVVVGGESGPGARPMHPDWARSLRDQCTAAGVPFLLKQWGAWAAIEAGGHSVFDYVTDDDRCQIVDVHGNLRGRPWRGWAIQDGTRDAVAMRRYGKGASGRVLDGRTWDQFPEVSVGACAGEGRARSDGPQGGGNG